jgi:hypothetical protein
MGMSGVVPGLYGAYPGGAHNPQGPPTGSSRVIRGSWNVTARFTGQRFAPSIARPRAQPDRFRVVVPEQP